MEKVRFSQSGEYIAVSGADGVLRIWETSTNSLKHNYTPSSHLSASCTCLEWAPTISKGTSKKKKKNKSFQGEVVAMGTAVGSLLLYGLAEGKLKAHSKQAHHGEVTGIAWDPNCTALYTCGMDGYIRDWDVETVECVSRWKGGKMGLSSIRIFNKFLLSCGQGITLWDLSTRTSIISYTGHPSVVTQLEPIPSSDYFVSMCNKERHLRIWSSTERNSVATLMVNEEPQSFHVSTLPSGLVCVAVVIKGGILNVFQHQLNGHVKKPIVPSNTLSIIDSGAADKTIPITASFLTGENPPTILLGYGSWVKIRFETLTLESISNVTTIKREYHKIKEEKASSSNAVSSLKKVVQIPKNVKHLQPEIDHSTIVHNETPSTTTISRKRKKGETVEEDEEAVADKDLPMDDRLKTLALNEPSAIPTGTNLAHLLSQGLHSKDTKILHSVLYRWDEDIVGNTVRSLPVQLIVPLLNEIKTMLGTKGQANHSVIRWLNAIFANHSSYLMSCTTGNELLGPFMTLLRTREALFPKICHLRGKLETMKGNIESKKYSAEIPNEALLTVQDESSDDDDVEDFMPSESEHEADDFLSEEEESETESEKDDDEEVDENSTTDDENLANNKLVDKAALIKKKKMGLPMDTNGLDDDVDDDD